MQFHSTANADNIQLSAKPWLRRRWRLLAIAAGVVTIAGLSFSGTLRASNEQELQASDEHKGCTTATLHGRYFAS